MKFIKYIILLLLVSATSAYSQSIRKNYQEMTQSEKDDLVSAFYQLRSGPDLINDLASYYDAKFDEIHASSASDNVFLAWHRYMLFELEQSIQAINPRLSIPVWDWRTDRSAVSDLSYQRFLGQFDHDWKLGRTFNTSQTLPTSADVSNVQAVNTSLYKYSAELEGSVIHYSPHLFVGGMMSTGASPRDPVFYFHYGMIDKLFQEWVEANNITPSGNSYQALDMPRYDGTYTFNGKTLPSINPDDMVDARALGVFWAENELAVLDDYTVSNSYTSQETFYYQYRIEATRFVIPDSKKAIIESVNKVVLKPGFHAQAGSYFLAKIDQDNNISAETGPSNAELMAQTDPWDNIDVKEGVFDQHDAKELTAYPNPAIDHVNLVLNESCADCRVSVYNVQGAKVLDSRPLQGANTTLDVKALQPGVYIIKVNYSEGATGTTKFTKR